MSSSLIKKTTFLGWLVCSLGALFYCYEYLLRIEPSVMVHELMQHFKATATIIGAFTAMYYYIYTPMQIFVGILIDRYGSRTILTMAVLVCAVGSFLFGISNGLLLASIGRFLIGFGSAFAFVSVLKLAAEWLPKHHFALFVGITTGLGMVGAMLGDIGLTKLVSSIGWKQTLYISAIVGFVLAFPIYFVIKDKKKEIVVLNENSSLTTGYKGICSTFFCMIKSKQMWLSGVVGCILYMSLSVFAELWGIQFLKTVYQLSDSQTAFACSLVFAGWLIGSPLNGWISDHTKTRKLPIIFGGIFAVIVLVLIIFRPFDMSTQFTYILLFLFGFFSSSQIICFAISRESNKTHVAATAVGFTNLVIMFGGVVFQPLFGKLLDVYWTGQIINNVRIYSASNYQHAFAILPVLFLISLFLTFLLKETHPAKTHDEFE